MDVQGGLNIRGYLQGQVDMQFFSVAGPYLGVKPYIEFGATRELEKAVECSLYVGLDGIVGVKASIFDRLGIKELHADKKWTPNLFKNLLKDCGADDRDILIALYNATDGDNWEDNDNWLSDRPIGEWYGVWVNSTGRVDTLVLQSNNLSGEMAR